ncbi:MAG: alpha/beta fold hydrolase, partial [Methyloligellaceae bacterium]
MRSFAGETMLPPQQTVALLNGTLSFRETGTGDPIVFLHGLNGNSGSWEKQFEQLVDKFRILAWDAPGYGQSSLQDPDVDRYVEVAAEWLQGRDAGQATVVGHSMGGVVAARLAINHPQLVRRLVLSCS